MKVAIEARALTGASGGVKRYVNELIEGISRNSQDIELSIIIDKDKKLQFSNIEKVVVKKYGQIGLKYWLDRQVPKAVIKTGADVVHYTKADVPSAKNMPTVVTIYDVIPLLYPKSQKFLNRLYWPKALARAVEHSDKIITISDTSKRDIVKELGVKKEKVVITKLGVDLNKFTFTEEKETANPYILYVGTIEPRKNVASLIKAFSAIKNEVVHKLTIVGRHYKGYEEIKQLAVKEEIQKRIEWLDGVSDKKLVELYKGASLFVWPSIYEGWGFPPQEAMACGAPVIVSNGGALPEVVGDAGIVVEFSSNDPSKRDNDPDFITNLSEEMKRVLNNEDLQTEMRVKGKAQAQKYTWQNVAKTTTDVYKEVLRTHP